MEEDDGIKLEPFNLAQERQDGFFDEEGHYVEKQDKEEEEAEKDAWFASTKGVASHNHLSALCRYLFIGSVTLPDFTHTQRSIVLRHAQFH